MVQRNRTNPDINKDPNTLALPHSSASELAGPATIKAARKPFPLFFTAGDKRYMILLYLRREKNTLMSRENSEARLCFKNTCQIRQLDEEDTLKRMKTLLEAYRRICWSTERRVEELGYRDGLYSKPQSELIDAIKYLECFDPDAEKNRLAERINTLFETRWMFSMVEHTMDRVLEFPKFGEKYYTILNDCYIGQSKMPESYMVQFMQVDRSRFYDWKKEAVMTFAVAFITDSVPKLKAYMSDPDYAETAFGSFASDSEGRMF